MAIQYAGGTSVSGVGTETYGLFNSDGTRRQLVDKLAAALAQAGWTYLSGSGTADVLMKSAVTPQGLSVCVRIYDPGTGNCAQVTMRSQAGDKVSSIAYMLPTNGKQFRIVANKYQFFFFATGSTLNSREIVLCGVPHVPDFIAYTLGNLETGWFQYTGTTDTDTTYRACFRGSLQCCEGTTYAAMLWNGTMTTWSNTVGAPSLQCGQSDTNWKHAWVDGSLSVVDALLAVSGYWRGLLWDAMVILGSYSSESIVPYDGGSFLAITQSNSRGTLFVKVA